MKTTSYAFCALQDCLSTHISSIYVLNKSVRKVRYVSLDINVNIFTESRFIEINNT
jgi:hypothetical protein